MKAIITDTRFPPGDFIHAELAARGWSTADLAQRMGGNAAKNQLTINLLMGAPTKGVLLGKQTAEGLSQAFGQSVELWMNLDRLWQKDMPEDSP